MSPRKQPARTAGRSKTPETAPVTVTLHVNGVARSLTLEPRVTLLDLTEGHQ